MTLELFTAIGALVGGSIAFLLDERLLALLFAAPARLRGGHDGSRARTCADDDAADGPGIDDHRVEPAAGDLASSRSRTSPAVRRGYAVRNLGRGIVGATGAGVARRCSASAAGSSRCR